MQPIYFGSVSYLQCRFYFGPQDKGRKKQNKRETEDCQAAWNACVQRFFSPREGSRGSSCEGGREGAKKKKTRMGKGRKMKEKKCVSG